MIKCYFKYLPIEFIHFFGNHKREGVKAAFKRKGKSENFGYIMERPERMFHVKIY